MNPCTGTRQHGSTINIGIITIIVINIIIRPHHSIIQVHAAYCYRRSNEVCLSVTIGSPAKTTEMIKMPFGLWTPVGPRYTSNVLDGGSRSLHGNGQLSGGERAAHCKVQGKYCRCAAEMRPFVKLFWPLVNTILIVTAAAALLLPQLLLLLQLVHNHCTG